jgi:hypothetical protein
MGPELIDLSTSEDSLDLSLKLVRSPQTRHDSLKRHLAGKPSTRRTWTTRCRTPWASVGSFAAGTQFAATAGSPSCSRTQPAWQALGLASGGPALAAMAAEMRWKSLFVGWGACCRRLRTVSPETHGAGNEALSVPMLQTTSRACTTFRCDRWLSGSCARNADASDSTRVAEGIALSCTSCFKKPDNAFHKSVADQVRTGRLPNELLAGRLPSCLSLLLWWSLRIFWSFMIPSNAFGGKSTAGSS